MRITNLIVKGEENEDMHLPFYEVRGILVGYGQRLLESIVPFYGAYKVGFTYACNSLDDLPQWIFSSLNL